MEWLEISLHLKSAKTCDMAGQLLLEAGSGGVSFNTESGNTVAGYFPSDSDNERRLRQVEAALVLLPELEADAAGATVTTRIVKEEDWANNWKAHFKPIRIGKRLVVSPPWEAPDLLQGDVLVQIDPGMAFGTGTHHTTQLCLALIEEHVTPGCSLADIGAGSGILSIAAVKLGAGFVYACDIDPLAVQIAGENAARNQVSFEVQPTAPAYRQFDIVVANILAPTVIEMLPYFAGVSASGGIVIVSGFTASSQDEVEAAAILSGLTLAQTRTGGEWKAMLFRHKPSAMR